MNHLEIILKKLEELGRVPTPEELGKLIELQAEIDRLYGIIIANQEAFGVQAIYVPRDGESIPENLQGGLNILELTVKE